MDETQLTPAEKSEYTLDIVACNVAVAFTEAYYYAFQKDRNSISSFYCPKQALGEDEKALAIVWNGEEYDDAASLQSHVQGLTHTYFDVESLDCDVLNPKHLPASQVTNGSGNDGDDLVRRMSITVMVMGSVRLEEQLKGPIREFSETFVLVPNPEKLLTNGINFDKGWQKEWLVLSQNFRFTEWGVIEVTEGDPSIDISTPMETDKNKNKANGSSTNTFRGSNKGIAGQFAAAGLLAKGKGKA